MKRLAPLLLLLLYSVSISGATFHLHYCADYLESVSILESDHKGCCCEKAGTKMRRTENCCHDVVVTLKSEDEHSRSEIATAASVLLVCVPAVFPTNVFAINKWHAATPQVERPPCVQRTIPDDLFVLNCTFRI